MFLILCCFQLPPHVFVSASGHSGSKWERSTPLVELTMGGIAYLLDYSLSFRAGYVHMINVTLNTSPDQEQIEIAIDPSVDTW